MQAHLHPRFEKDSVLTALSFVNDDKERLSGSVLELRNESEMESLGFRKSFRQPLSTS